MYDIVIWPALAITAVVGLGVLFVAQACFLVSDYWRDKFE